MIIFWLILVISSIRSVVDGSFNLYKTNPMLNDERLDFDCFHYYTNSESVDHRFDNSIRQVIEYCIRSEDKFDSLIVNPETYTKNFTFQQLLDANVTVQQLLSWSAPIDLIERYLLYLSQPTMNRSSAEDLFYNCTYPWFGSRCQYSFNINNHGSFHSVVQTTFDQIVPFVSFSFSSELANSTCYKHLKCNRGGADLCLDWREICNGKVDCIGDGEDEAECWQMEINECNENEYRCHNGLCIPKDFWQDDQNNPDCLDRSDEPDDSSSFSTCYQNPTFRCEEHACRPGKEDFACGDGECVARFQQCINDRQHLFKNSLLARDSGTLADNCWSYLVCFAVMMNNNYSLCRDILRSLENSISSAPDDCEHLSQFPSMYAWNGHIRFLYSNLTNLTFITQTIWDMDKLFWFTKDSNLFNSATSQYFDDSRGLDFLLDLYRVFDGNPSYAPLSKHTLLSFSLNRPNISFHGPEYWYEGGGMYTVKYFRLLLPDYVCYDNNMCDYITPTFNYSNLTCLHGNLLDIDKAYNYADFTTTIENYFSGCSMTYKTNLNKQFRTHPSVYCCQNSSKCISKHRLLDGIIDCHLEDDETYNASCLLNQTYRFRCGEKDNRCFSPIVDSNICNTQRKDNLDRIYFQQICTGIIDIFPQQINTIEYTDETECHHWPCSNTYTKCDGFDACTDGHDEDDCTVLECPSRSRPCITLENNTLTCLSLDRINDGIIDCFGASDETNYCRNKNVSLLEKNTFLCTDTESCISSSQLCDDVRDCLSNTDEQLCSSSTEIWSDNNNCESLTEIETVLCQLFAANKHYPYFSLETSLIYPSQSNEPPQKVIRERRDIEPSVEQNETEYNAVQATLCNRGIYARISHDSDNESYICFCPPSYYGRYCQYQNQRVSLTLRFFPVDRHTIYSIIVKLVDQNYHLHSYEQFTFMALWGCRIKFNIYLLYSTRPKNNSNIYSVHIHAYDKNTLIHNASWYLSIPFAFLPVNRLVSQLILPVQQSSNSYPCNLTCDNGGHCKVYENTRTSFCHCLTNWTGERCQIPVNCNDCSSDSLCVGSFNNRSICICSTNKVGPRCLLPSTCPSNACENNGRCVLSDDNVGTNNYICICSEHYYGSQCEYTKRKLIISFYEILLPSYVQVYISSVSNASQPSTFIMMKKLLQDQQTVLFHISKPFHMVFVKITNDYYLAAVQRSSPHDLSTTISSKQRCSTIHQLFNSTIANLPPIRRVKYYPLICQNHTSIPCFYDETYMCLCTSEHYPNCFHFDHQSTLTCQQIGYCQNNALRLQDDPTCPSDTICICSDCYFGQQCQFYAKGFGLTLDDILRYELQPRLSFTDQRMPVTISAVSTVIFFLIGMISGTLSCLTFKRKPCKEVGCGLYLFASSITSILTMLTFMLKYWFLIFSQLNIITNRTLLQIGCVSIEPLLKIFLFTDSWFNACVAIERGYTVFKGLTFHKLTSRQVAKRVICLLPVLIVLSLLHEPIYRDLFDDEEEHRTWCVNQYSPYLQYYNSIILLVHFSIPFIINLLSAFFVIISVARKHTKVRTEQTYFEHLRKQIQEHKHILISPLALVLLSLPRLLISLMSSCIKSSRNPWLYLCGYFVSFIPPMLIFVVFIVPSGLYKKEFKKAIKT